MKKTQKQEPVKGFRKTKEELMAQRQMKAREGEQEKIVCFAREKLLPFLNTKNKTIDQSKIMFDVLAVALQQSLFSLLRTTNVSDMKLAENIKNNYPDAKDYVELLGLLDSETLMLATEALQWMNAKIDAQLKDERKDRGFADLKLEF